MFVEGIVGYNTNGTDAFRALEATLTRAGTTMKNVLNCLFYVREESAVLSLFGGFFDVFNVDAPPPPSRTEFVGRAAQAKGQVTAKCVAAMPLQ